MLRHRYRLSLLLAFLAVGSAGCGSLIEAMEGPTYPRRVVTLNNTDASLDLDAYITRGMPATTRGWTFSERSDAIDVLFDLYREQPEALPRLDSPRSKVLFNKLVSNEVMKPVLDSTLPTQSRLIELRGAAMYETLLLQLYTLAHVRTGMYDEELSLLVARSIWIEATHLDLRLASVRDGMPLIFADPAHEMDSMRDEIKRTMLGVPRLLKSEVLFGDAARVRMVQGILPSAKKLLAELDPMTHTEFRTAMDRAKLGQTNSQVLSAYNSLSALNDAAGQSQIDSALATRPKIPRVDANWSRFESKSAGVSAEFPGKPLERVRQGGIREDEASVVYSLWTQTDDGVRFTVLRVRGLVEAKDRTDYVRKFAKFFPKRNVVKSRVLDKQSMLTCEVEFRFNHVGIVRVIESGEDVTHVIVEASGNDRAGLRKKADRFFNSLDIEPFHLNLPAKSPGSITAIDTTQVEG